MNEKMKRCKTCQYRAAPTCANGCDYYPITRQRRGCPVDNCDKYIKGPKIPLKNFWKSPVREDGDVREFYKERKMK